MLTKVTKKIRDNIYFYPKNQQAKSKLNKTQRQRRNYNLIIIIYTQDHTSKRDRLELNYFAHGILWLYRRIVERMEPYANKMVAEITVRKCEVN